jgi:hypothetical protein
MLGTSENHLRPNLDCMVDDLRQRYAQTVVTFWTTFVHVIIHFGLEETPVLGTAVAIGPRSTE